MSRRLLWTSGMDRTLLRLRAEALGWDRIASAMSLTLNAVTERGRRLGARLPPRVPVLRDDPNRPPLETGHPVAWAVLTEGTVLAGSQCPPLRLDHATRSWVRDEEWNKT